MSDFWCIAKTVIYLEKNGRQITKLKNDWIEPGLIGRQQAKALLAKDQIAILKPDVLRDIQDLTDCSILTRGLIYDSERTSLGLKYPAVPMAAFKEFPEERGRYLIWDMGAKLRHELILVGFDLLKNWQLAVPLLNYDTLAGNVGTPDEQAETKAIIHDLRVPVYDTRVIFARQCQETRRLFKLWDGSQLGFLRALYQARPIVNALPPSWVME
jgi:hypothetical protein